MDDFDKAGFDIVEREGFEEGIDVDFLGFEEVGDICQTVESTKLEQELV